MENEFLSVMSKKTDEQLIKIVTVNKNEYVATALEAAEIEIQKRGIDSSKIEEIKEEAIQEVIIDANLDTIKVKTITRVYNFLIDIVVGYMLVLILGYVVVSLNIFLSLWKTNIKRLWVNF